MGNSAILALGAYFDSIGAHQNITRQVEAIKLAGQNSWMYETVERNASGRVVRPCYG